MCAEVKGKVHPVRSLLFLCGFWALNPSLPSALVAHQLEETAGKKKDVTNDNLLPMMQLVFLQLVVLKLYSDVIVLLFLRNRAAWKQMCSMQQVKVVLFSITASAVCQVEPVGRWFEAFVKRRNRNASTSFQELEDKKELSEESEDEELQLEEFPMLKTLDPKDWKVFTMQSFLSFRASKHRPRSQFPHQHTVLCIVRQFSTIGIGIAKPRVGLALTIVCNPRTWGIETGKLEVQSPP